MSNQATLRRLDGEITQRRQQIAALQVEIARLEDTRRVLMSLDEADQMAAHSRHEPPPSTLMNGSHAKPVLIVRKTTEDSPPAEKGPTGRKKERKPRNMSARAGWREKVKALLDEADAEPMTASELGNYFGIPIGKARKDLQNALYYLQKSNDVHRDDEGRYSRPTRQ